MININKYVKDRLEEISNMLTITGVIAKRLDQGTMEVTDSRELDRSSNIKLRYDLLKERMTLINYIEDLK